ncbi:zinc finger CCCH-type with G patch domain-containing protein [Caerostris extrusa]|uniref:Zinc finger CCCH-type with G patch domain-containing protein n=1 Tax=Caerostris extrusa TaxID=172846 RepID=A0AAV4RMP1_CAEEX|nr:zinc finger CCCH-type with G patch domain-containing protein [Caerostris extrusa]
MNNVSNDPLTEYKLQLLSVEESLKSADADKQADLLDLKAKLTEVISLLQGNSVELEVNTKNTTSDTIDDEFQKFQHEIQELEGDTSAHSKDADDIEESDAHNEFLCCLVVNGR